MTQYVRRGDDTWTRFQDGTWSKWNLERAEWEPQAGSPPPPPPPPPAEPAFEIHADRERESPALRWVRAAREDLSVALLLRSPVFLALGSIVLIAAVAVAALSFGRIDDSPRTFSEKLDGEVSLAAARVQEQKSVRVAMTMSMAVPEGTMTMNGRGAFDVAGQKGRLKMTLRAQGQSAPAQNLGPIEVVYDFSDGFIMYMKWPQMAQMLNTGTPWIKMDMQKISEEAGFDLEALTQLGQDNPMHSVDYLHGVKNVRAVGKERVRGVSTTHYKGVVDFEALLDDLPKEAAASVEQLMELSDVAEVPVDIWLGNKGGLPRRLTFDYSNVLPSAEGGVPLGEMTMDFFGYGRPVNITTPGPHEVTDLFQLMNQAS